MSDEEEYNEEHVKQDFEEYIAKNPDWSPLTRTATDHCRSQCCEWCRIVRVYLISVMSDEEEYNEEHVKRDVEEYIAKNPDWSRLTRNELTASLEK